MVSPWGRQNYGSSFPKKGSQDTVLKHYVPQSFTEGYSYAKILDFIFFPNNINRNIYL